MLSNKASRKGIIDWLTTEVALKVDCYDEGVAPLTITPFKKFIGYLTSVIDNLTIANFLEFNQWRIHESDMLGIYNCFLGKYSLF